VVVVYEGSVGSKIFFTDSMSEVIPADSTMTAMMMALKYLQIPIQHFADICSFRLGLPSAHEFTDHNSLRIRKCVEVASIVYV
jgi:hypothetical protein